MMRRAISVSCVATLQNQQHIGRTSGLVWDMHRWASVTTMCMPSLSPTMEQGKIIEWSTEVGALVAVGGSICKLETDKAVVSFDNQDSDMYIARIIAPPGAVCAIGEPICLAVDDEGDLKCDEVMNWKPTGAAAAVVADAPETPAPQASVAAPISPSSPSSGRVFASPLARNVARELGMNLSDVTGTGGAVGRITKSDVEKAAANPKPKSAAAAAPVARAAAAAPVAAPGASFVDTPVSGMRATIAKRLTQSKNIEIPHYYLMNECKADSMLSTIKHLNSKGKDKYKVSVNDYIVKCIARANLLVPNCNSHWHGDFIRQYHNVDVSVAVATPSGLITPIVKNAHIKGLVEISNETKQLAKLARDGGLTPAQYTGGTVTVSNLGAMGVQNFTAIINPPHSMILACGAVVPKPEMIMNGETGEYEMTGKVEKTMNFTASFDHRVVDGAVGAEWFKHFKDAIENPLSLLL